MALSPDLTTTFDLHIGLSPEQIEDLSEFIPLTDPDDIGADLDYAIYHGDPLGGASWEEWGEGPWPAEDNSEEYPGPEMGEHVVIRLTSVVACFLTLGALRMDGYHLIPMRFTGQRGTIACITDSADWSEKFITLNAGSRYPEL